MPCVLRANISHFHLLLAAISLQRAHCQVLTEDAELLEQLSVTIGGLGHPGIVPTVSKWSRRRNIMNLQ